MPLLHFLAEPCSDGDKTSSMFLDFLYGYIKEGSNLPAKKRRTSEQCFGTEEIVLLAF
jgi:hypothetical protein